MYYLDVATNNRKEIYKTNTFERSGKSIRMPRSDYLLIIVRERLVYQLSSIGYSTQSNLSTQ